MLNKELILAKQQALISGKQLFDIELSTRCNKVCSACPRKALTRKLSDMPPEIFDKLSAWLPNNCYVMFAGFGEPILNPNIYSYIKQLKVKSPDISVSLYTNGLFLNSDVIKKLFDSGLDLIQLSIVDKSELCLALKILKIINALGYLKNIRVNMLYSNEYKKLNLLKEIDKSFRKYPVLFCLKQIHSKGGSLYDFNYCGEIKTCGTFFMDTFIDLDGNIQICSNDINGKNRIGNIQNMSFKELIEKKKSYFGNKQIAEICKNCSDEYRELHFQEV